MLFYNHPRFKGVLIFDLYYMLLQLYSLRPLTLQSALESLLRSTDILDDFLIHLKILLQQRHPLRVVGAPAHVVLQLGGEVFILEPGR